MTRLREEVMFLREGYQERSFQKENDENIVDSLLVGVEIRSAWFDKLNIKTLGSLKSSKNICMIAQRGLLSYALSSNIHVRNDGFYNPKLKIELREIENILQHWPKIFYYRNNGEMANYSTQELIESKLFGCVDNINGILKDEENFGGINTAAEQKMAALLSVFVNDIDRVEMFPLTNE